MSPEQQGSSSFPSGGTPIDLRDRVPLYVDDIAPHIAKARRLDGRPRVHVCVTQDQLDDLNARLAVQVPLMSGDFWGETVTFLIDAP